MAKPISKSMLSLDLGKKRIGLAGCDPLGITITTIPALIRKNNEEDMNYIRKICIQRQVKGLIIGLPLDENGKETVQSEFCKTFGGKIAKMLKLPFVFINEHSSTWEASQTFKMQKDKTGKIDSASAAILLQQWLREGPDIKAYN